MLVAIFTKRKQLEKKIEGIFFINGQTYSVAVINNVRYVT